MTAPVSSRQQLAALVRSEIRAAGLYQQDVADRLGVSRKHLSGIVQGRAVPSLELLDRLMGVLGREVVITSRVATRPPPRR